MIGIYARVSTEEQARSGFSLNDQLRECRRKAGEEPVKEYVDEGVSGEVLDRPALRLLRADVKAGLISTVVCFDPDRLSRKLMHQLLLTEEWEKQGISLVFVNGDYAKTPEGNLFYSMRGAIAEFEKAKITERMSRGRKEKARQGRVLRDFGMYGYRYDPHTEQLLPDEAEATTVRLIYDLFTSPDEKVKGINGIAKRLTEQGIPTKRGAGTWHRQVVRQILQNEAYAGRFYQNRWNTEGMVGNKHKPRDEKVAMRPRPREEWILVPCQPIISDEQFQLAQQMLMQSRRRWAGQSQHAYLLSGLLRCRRCGNTMTGRRGRNWGKPVFEYTDRKHTAGSKQQGCGFTIRCEVLDELVWQQVRCFLDDPAAMREAAFRMEQQHKQNPEALDERESRLMRELERIRTKRKRLLHTFAESDAIIADDLQEVFRECRQKELQLEDQLAHLREEAEAEETDSPTEEAIAAAVGHMISGENEEPSDELKRELIRQIIQVITVDDRDIRIDTF
ncbi:MAG: recombinase family protein [Clostridia bacterium]